MLISALADAAPANAARPGANASLVWERCARNRRNLIMFMACHWMEVLIMVIFFYMVNAPHKSFDEL